MTSPSCMHAWWLAQVTPRRGVQDNGNLRDLFRNNVGRRSDPPRFSPTNRLAEDAEGATPSWSECELRPSGDPAEIVPFGPRQGELQSHGVVLLPNNGEQGLSQGERRGTSGVWHLGCAGLLHNDRNDQRGALGGFRCRQGIGLTLYASLFYFDMHRS